ncbi:MAG TPA: cytochrome c oxidase subunit II [Candidatus Eisenbacteria bacterium]|nr:cytochrome c oxidase subunit II [Candidatus Eisenbacteria bacterium]
MIGFRLFPEQASTIAPQVDALLFFLIGLSLFFSLLIAGLIVVFMIRYRRRPGGDHVPDIHGSLALEGLWTAIPFVLAMIVFFWGASIFATMQRPPDDALEVHVVGKQWMWKLQHMEGRREINELHVPVGRAVKLLMTSEDVIHSFYVPEFRVKQDAVPGRYSRVWFEATKPGTYHLFCAEYCGTLHSGMIGRIVAMEPAAFEAWLGGRQAGANVPIEVAGEGIFRAQGCGTCHRADGSGQGPALQGVFGKTVMLASGQTLTADEGYLRESILDPNAQIVAGYKSVMPTFQGLLSEEDVMRLIAYVKSLKAGEGGS